MNVHDLIAYQNIGLPEDILRRKLHGDFPGALRLIDRRLQDPKTNTALANSLRFHREMLLRLPGEFPYTKEEALALVRADIPDFTMAELEDLMDSRAIRWIYMGGKERIFGRFYDSILKAVPGMAQRAKAHLPGVESNTIPKENPLDAIIAKLKAQGSLSYKIRIRAALRLEDDQFTPGMFLRAHLPIPADCSQQRDIRIEALSPAGGALSPADAPQRTVCWEKTMVENQPFSVTYSYCSTVSYVDAYHGHGLPSGASFDTEEKAPHIVFTPYIRALAGELTQGLTDPLEKARAFYDFITKNMQYTYMPDYFVLDQIAQTCALEYSGDCGVFALLFITLCRCVGIPAQWQSGNTAEPDYIGCHDWARFYAEPYGWLPVDPSYGVSAHRQGCEERRQFYFGNLDPFRMIANREFQADFTIPKAHWRSDPYDNQSGELETTDRGFTGSQFTPTKEILCCEEIP